MDEQTEHLLSESLKEDIELYSRERKRVQKLISSISGRGYARRDTILNIIFLMGILILFTLESTTELIPSSLSLQLGVLLVSLKIVWMIHINARFNHFQFWILNSLEQRVNKIYRVNRAQTRALITLEERVGHIHDITVPRSAQHKSPPTQSKSSPKRD